LTLDHASELIRHTLFLALMVSAPVLLVGLVVGLVFSLLQAMTNLQEQSLSLVPKIVAMMVIAIVLLPWIGQHVIDYARQVFTEGLLH
jgi:flagellar biosynthetic protein FliQ